ncbi:hypothetical protein OESDEN_14923, partial [Oesophagostomum dentatum]
LKYFFTIKISLKHFKSFQETLEKIRDKASKSDVRHYYEYLDLITNHTYLYYNGDVAIFESLAVEALNRSRGDVLFEDLVKFNVANALSKQILCYLATKHDLEQLEGSITRRYAIYKDVRNTIKRLSLVVGGVYRKIYEVIEDILEEQLEDEWINEKIDATLISILNHSS